MGADHGDLLHISGERKRLMFIFQQDKTFQSHLFIQLHGGGLMERMLQLFQMRIGILKEAQPELQHQDPLHDTVDQLHADPPFLHCLLQAIGIGFRPWIFHIKPRIHRADPCFLVVGSHPERVNQAVQSDIVRYHDPLETHFLSEQVCEKSVRSGDRLSIQTAVRTHDRSQPGLGNRRLEWLAVDLPEVTLCHQAAAHIQSALCDPVADIMLRGAEHPLRQIVGLQSLCKCARHGCSQGRVFPVSLRGPAPSGVSRDIHNRRQCLTETDMVHLLPDHFRHLRDKICIKSGCLRDCTGKYVRFRELCSGTCFTVNQRRDPQLCLLCQEMLQFIHVLRNLPHIVRRCKCADMADPLRDIVFKVRDIRRDRHQTGHLIDLLFKRHPSDQILCPLFCRKR